jgi:hypothetical protein
MNMKQKDIKLEPEGALVRLRAHGKRRQPGHPLATPV